MKRKIFLFVGAPACGKGTRIKELEKIGYKSLSISSILRKAGYDVGKGCLIQDEDVIKTVIPEIKKAKGNIILDGFPRTVPQAKALFKENIRINNVFNVNASEKVILERSMDRLSCSKCHATYTKSNFNPPKKEGICDCCGGELIQRPDDTEELIKKRLREFKEKTKPVLNVLENNNVPIIDIDAALPPEEILKYVV